MSFYEGRTAVRQKPASTLARPLLNAGFMRRICQFAALGILLGLNASAQTVQLSWNPSTDPTITNYNLCWGGSTNPYPYTNAVGTNLTATISNLTPGLTYLFACQAEDGNGLLSSFCPAVAYTVISPCTISMSGLSQTYTGQPVTIGLCVNPTNVPVTVTYNGNSSPPVNTGGYTVIATSASSNYFASATNILTITPATAAVTLQNLAQTYSGAAQPVTASTVPAGLAALVTYNGSVAPPAAPGNYTVAATINNSNYVGGATNVLVISSASAALALGNLTQTYSGSAEAATVTTTPPGLSVTVTYNGSATVPVNAGTYTVVASSTSADYIGSVTNQLTINKAAATLEQSGLSAVYNGSAISITNSTTPSGLQVNSTYDGIPEAPTNTGSYTVLSTIVNSNYTGSATNTLVVSQAPASIDFSNLLQTFSGVAAPVTAVTVPTNLTVSISYDGLTNAPTNAGSYVIVASVVDSNYVGSATNTLQIAPALPQVAFGGLYQTYDGSPESVTVSTTPAYLTTSVTYNGSAGIPVNAGSYTVVCAVTGSNYSGFATNTMVIAPAAATIRLASMVQAWTGNPLGVTAVTTPGGLGLTITYNGVTEQPSALGTYTVVATINNTNYTGSVTGTFVIKTVAPPSSLIISWSAAYTPVTLFESTNLMAWSASSEVPDSVSNDPSDTITTTIPIMSGNKFFVATSNGRGIPIEIRYL